MTLRKMANSHAFSLVEIMVAVLVIGLALVGVVSAFSHGIILVSDTMQLSLATMAAQDEMEIIRDMSYATVLGLSGTFTTSALSYLKDGTGTVTVDDPFSDDDIRRVTVTVSWSSRQGRAMSKSLVNLVTNDE